MTIQNLNLPNINLPSVSQMTHAYKIAPWRQQRQWIGSALLAVVAVTMIATLYLDVTSQAAIAGREIQDLTISISTSQQISADLQTQVATLTSSSMMQTRALELGFRPMKQIEVEYLAVPGYVKRQPAILSAASTPQLSALSILPEYNQSLLDWVDEQIYGFGARLAMREQYARRAQVLFYLLGMFALAIIAQIFRIQNSPEAETFRERASNYAYELRTFYPDRGEIYDRNGHLLAGNKSVYEVGVNLSAVKDSGAIALAVSSQLNIDYAKILATLQNPPQDLAYVVIADYIEAPQVATLRELKKNAQDQALEGTMGALTGLEFKAHPERSYPENSLASNVIGFVNREGRGYFGVEEKYDLLLAGNPVQALVPTDPNKAYDIPRALNGTTLLLTLNRDLQAATEQILDESLSTYGAQRGTIVIMDPRNGEVLAMASTPRMNLNEFWNYDEVYKTASDFNPPVSRPYEPGSVIKILTMAAALDTGMVGPQTAYTDTGSILVGGVTIQNWDQQPWGVQNMIGCLQHSLNVCMAMIATQMGAGTFYGYMDNFGFGHLSGIDLAGESAGRLKIPGDADWYPVDLGTNAFGQGVTATPIQMMMAASSVANKGRMVIPHTLFAMVRDGREYNAPAQYAGSPISIETATTLSEMLAVSLESEASLALVPGYRIAGKTGTAQIPVDGFYDATQTNTSFIGWGPIDDPHFMIYVWLERPSSSIWGSETAAPVFSEVAQKTILLLNIPPDAIRRQLLVAK